MTVHSDNQLEPCPFCGAELERFPTVDGTSEWAKHPENGCDMTRIWIEPANYPAWNTRSKQTEPVRAEDLRLVGNISWRSDDRDNMEFVTRASCYQVEALNRILASLKRSGE